MIIGNRLRQLRERKRLTQGDVEARTGLMKCYISRVENGHTVPSIETLERFAAALEIPLYQIFHLGEKGADNHSPDCSDHLDELPRAGCSSEDGFILKLGALMHRIPEHGRDVLLLLARKMARR